MGFVFDDRKTLRYADLFKGYRGMAAKGEENSSQCCQGWRSTSNESSTCDSSSSGLSTPFGSELGLSESEDGDFIAELSRQMAECMLQEEEEEEEEERNLAADSAASRNSKYGLSSNNRVCDVDPPPCLELRNQVPISKQIPVSRATRVKGGEFTQQMQFQRREQNPGRYRERKWRIGQGRGNGQVGSGMRAIFLGRSGSKDVSSGTGVFLPRVANDPVHPKKKSGLSTVLIPNRVLEALELHFNRVPDSAAPPLVTGGSPHYASRRDEWSMSKGRGNRHSKIHMGAANRDEEMQILPQEWTY